ncbi:MAG TPA: hypothetical protein VIN38_00680 [Thiobacillus sp.]
MIELHTPIRFIVVSLLLAQSSLTAAHPMPTSGQLVEQTMPWEQAAPSGLLPALKVDVCAHCELSREAVSEIEKGYVIAALAAGYQINILETTEVRIVETGVLENGMPFAKGETEGMWFRAGGLVQGESMGSVAGRLTFMILSGNR